MGFIEEICKNLKFNEFPINAGYKLTLLGDAGAYVEGVKSVISYSEVEILLSVKNGGIKLSGEKLYIKKYCQGDLAICGKVLKIEVL